MSKELKDKVKRIFGRNFEDLGHNNESIHLGYYRHDDIENCEKSIIKELEALDWGEVIDISKDPCCRTMRFDPEEIDHIIVIKKNKE